MPFVCYDRAVELVRRGHEVHVVTTSLSAKSGAFGEKGVRSEHGVYVHYTHAPAHQWSETFADRCFETAVMLSPDLIHSESFDRSNRWWEPFKGEIPLAVTMHGVGFGGWLTKWNGYRALGWSPEPFPHAEVRGEADGLTTFDRVIAVSKWEHRIIRDQYAVRNVRLVYSPIAPEFFEEVPEQKRSGFLCAAISGSGPRGFSAARDAARRAAVQLVQASTVPRSEMPALYDRVKAVVLPTAYAQGYDLTIAEGRARGCPAIMTPTGSYLDEAEEWDRFVDLGDVDGLATAMREEPPEVTRLPFKHHPGQHVECWLGAVT